MLKDSLSKYVNSVGYNEIPDNMKIKVIRRIIGNVNRVAKAKELNKYYRNK